VLIATPNDFHKPYAIASMQAGKHAISEKPVTLSSADLAQILEASKKTGRFFTVHQNRRWDTDYLTLKNAVATGLIQKPYVVESRVQGSNGMIHGWRCFKQHGGGMVYDWGVHLIDQMALWLPERVVEVSAVLQKVIADEVDDVFTAMFRFETGLMYLVNVSMNSFISQPRWHACAIDGTIQIDGWEGGKIVRNKDDSNLEWAETITYTAAGPTRSMAPRPKNTVEELEAPVVKQNCFEVFYKNIYEAVQGKAEPQVTPAQITRVMRLIELVFEADARKQSVQCSV